MITRPTPLLLTLVCGLALLQGPAANAADPGGAAAALKVLTAPHTEEAPAASESPAAGGRQTLQVQKSETLDMLVRRLNPGSPFKDEVFRRALADLNPTTLPNAANNLLKRGSTLVLPNAQDLHRTLLRHYPSTASWLLAPPEKQVEHSSAASHGPSKNRWVRFP